jgi:hypothetical protein
MDCFSIFSGQMLLGFPMFSSIYRPVSASNRDQVFRSSNPALAGSYELLLDSHLRG